MKGLDRLRLRALRVFARGDPEGSVESRAALPDLLLRRSRLINTSSSTTIPQEPLARVTGICQAQARRSNLVIAGGQEVRQFAHLTMT